MTEELKQRAAKLVESVETLTATVSDLRDDANTHRRQIRQTRLALTLTLVIIILMGVLGISAISVVATQVDTNRRLNATTTQVLCPLLDLFLKSYDPSTVPPSKKDFYETAFKKLRRMPDAINCEDQE